MALVRYLFLIALTLPALLVAQEARVTLPMAGQDARQTEEQTLTQLENAEKTAQPSKKMARNIILFVGDGMGVSTVTAARIFDGQRKGKTGEEHQLEFEKDAYLALAKVYNSNQQVPDSAGTMTAMVTGQKTKAGVISLNQNALRGEPTMVKGYEIMTFLELAELAGKSTGIISTARLTHATPAACYAHSGDRDWEGDTSMPSGAAELGIKDIALQLVEFPYGNGLELALGGGRRYFLPKTVADPEDSGAKGDRADGRDLTKEWLSKYPQSAYVYDRSGMMGLNPAEVQHVLGLFERSHMEYEEDRPHDTAGEPSLAEMTSFAIDMLSRNEKGYFLMVEAGRIDHAHHAGNAYRALLDTVALNEAFQAAREKVSLDDTMIIVTADHSHVFTMGGYPTRGNDILGLVVENDHNGLPGALAKDGHGHHYTTLGYHNGPGYRATPENPSPEECLEPDYQQVAAIPLGSETHAGEDVAIYAFGPGAHLFRGVVDQTMIFHIMNRTLQQGLQF